MRKRKPEPGDTYQIIPITFETLMTPNQLAEWKRLADLEFPQEAREGLPTLDYWISDACTKKAAEATEFKLDPERMAQSLAKLRKQKRSKTKPRKKARAQ